MEYEYKFYLAESFSLESIKQDSLWQDLGVIWQKPKKLVATYYEDEQGYLVQEQLVLRQRQEDELYFTTLKGPSLVEGQFSARPEFNVLSQPGELNLNELFLAMEQASGQEEVLAQITKWRAKLEEIKEQIRTAALRTDITRQLAQFSYGQAEIELALDEGWLYGGKLKEKCYELELELVAGPVEDLIALAQVVQEKAFVLDRPVKNKYQRCLELKASS